MKLLTKISIAFGLSLMILMMFVPDASAQNKKDPAVTEVSTNSPVFNFVYKGKPGDGALTLQIHDRLRQFVAMDLEVIYEKSINAFPEDPLIKLINIPEFGGLAFRQAETLEEAQLPVDGITVLEVRRSKLKAAAAIIYLP